jgi:hypothetical protein
LQLDNTALGLGQPFLGKVWIAARFLTKEESRTILDEFVSTCVRRDFASKFSKNLGMGKQFGDRYFVDGASYLDPKLAFGEAVGSNKGEVIVDTVSGSQRNSIGYHLIGRPRTLADLAVDEYDAVIRITSPRTFRYAFQRERQGDIIMFLTQQGCR